ncbi:MAG: serine protein kinase PrkA [Polyangiaceae bacterium]|nr:serine protein kinase PrkA [Polyangiaceae bacterium]
MPDDQEPLAARRLAEITARVRDRYRTEQRLLSFDEYLSVLAAHPERHARDASRYLRDALVHYGTREIERPWGSVRRFNLFDLGFLEEERRRDALVAHEELQNDLFRALSNFAREGRANRLVLLHGPNGSAKSTLVGCLFRALEHYSTLDEGALYRFHWVFPTQKTLRGPLGFGGDEAERPPPRSFAHLDEEQIEARLVVEVRDHPLFLLPVAERRRLLAELLPAGAEPLPDWMARGQLSQKNQQVVDALMATYKGDLAEVLRHVQVERTFVSHRYRVAASTIGPQMAVDASERQITADRNLAALPTALQAMTLFEAHGELVEAQGGVLEFSDLLKRPLDAFKYLQLSVETGEVALSQQSLQLNCVMIGSANELHLDALRGHPEWASFRGRFELIRAPYLLSYLDEQAIYDAQIAPQLRVFVAPHATTIAAMFAVLTRLSPVSAEALPAEVGPVAASLSAWEKLELYARGALPDRLDADDKKLLRAHLAELPGASERDGAYEGRVGASPRELRAVLLNAAQHADLGHLSPLGVLEELGQLALRRQEFDWLDLPARDGGYHDAQAMLEALRAHLFDRWEEEMRVASGFVDETTYAELFERYVAHVGVWTKGEKIRNRVTGVDEDPDAAMMSAVEALLGVEGDGVEYRRGLFNVIAAWAIEHPGQKIEPLVVFPDHVQRMRKTVFVERRRAVALLCRDLVVSLRDGASSGLSAARAREVEAMRTALVTRFGHSDASARDAASSLVRWRFAELVD